MIIYCATLRANAESLRSRPWNQETHKRVVAFSTDLEHQSLRTLSRATYTLWQMAEVNGDHFFAQRVW